MYLLYLDSSGLPDFPPPYGKGRDNWYVVAGLAIQHQDWENVYRGLSKVVAKYFPTIPAGGFEIRYGDLINKRGLWGSLTDIERKNCADDIFNLILSLKPVMFAVAIDKVSHYKKYSWGKRGPEHPRQLAVRFMVPRYSKFLQRIHDTGIMIYDSETAFNDRRLREFLVRGRLRGVVFEKNPFYDPLSVLMTQNRLEGVIETIFFIESHASPVVQLTDFCAYAIWTHFERQKSNRFNQIHQLFDQDQGKIYGLLIWSPK